MKKFIRENLYYLKSVILVLGCNAALYFGVKLFLNNYHIISSPLDSKIPFLPGFMYIYMLWYPFLIISFYFLWKYNKDKYKKLIIVTIFSLIISYLCFIIYPTMVIRPEIKLDGSITNWLVNYIYDHDYPVNCFPSVHCLLCFILMFSTFNDKKLPIIYRVVVSVISVLIIFSTLFVKQHVIIDVIGAFIVSFFAYIETPYFKIYKNK